ncbi:MAG: macro domain-containing protein [Christensenellales bacterium]
MPLKIMRQDITKIKADAVVNAANVSLEMGGGVCGALFQAAGPEALRAACWGLAPIHTGDAVITPGFSLPARFIIHAAGPVYDGEDPAGSEALLRKAYRSALACAVENGCRSVAFPLLSSGLYGYPKAEALQVASDEISRFLDSQAEGEDLMVYLLVFDKLAFQLSKALQGEVENYLDEHYIFPSRSRRVRVSAPEYSLSADFEFLSVRQAPLPARSLDELMKELDEPFHETLLRLIDKKGLDDVGVYKRANLSRQLFSKIRAGKGYKPGKQTVLALAIGMKLSLEETRSLLERAGYALTHSQKSDVIIEYFIVSRNYDILLINQVLYSHDLQPLGG